MSVHVTLKLASSLDGKIATSTGESRWITGETARAEVHKMRAAHEAVLIGAETARRDDPSLLARLDPAPARQPKRFVLTTAYQIPTSGRLFENLDQSPLRVLGGSFEHEPARSAAQALTQAGAELGAVIADDLVTAAGLAVHLIERFYAQSLLVEGGGRLAASLIRAGLVNRIEWMRAPILIGEEGRPALGGMALTQLSSAPRFQRVAVRELGPDLWESYDRI